MRKAAAVPASKAKIGTIYAVRRDGELVRFRVVKTTTHRIADNGGPADYESEVTGDFIFGDKSKPERATIAPNQLLGQYEEYEELLKQVNAEKAAHAAKVEAEKKTRDDLIALLYKLTGLPVPPDRYDRRSVFTTSYSGVDINREGVAALLATLRKLVPSTDPSDLTKSFLPERDKEGSFVGYQSETDQS